MVRPRFAERRLRDAPRFPGLDNLGNVTHGGPYPTGDGPDDPEERTGGDEGVNEDGEFHGWVPPSERSWRHPSEMFSPGTAASAPGPVVGLRPRRSRRTWATVLVGTGVAAAVIAGGLVLATSVDPDHNASLTARTASESLPQAVTGHSVPATISQVARALVMLSVTTSSGTVVRGGVAIAADGLVATTVGALGSGGTLTATTSDGKQMPAALVAIDPQSDIAVVRVPAKLPVAHFADDGGLHSGRKVVAMSVSPAAGASVVNSSWSWETVTTVAAPVSSRNGAGMAAIGASGASSSSSACDVLVDASGQIVGIRAVKATLPAATSQQVYLPSQLVLGVANELARSGQVDHGWLGIEARDDLVATSPKHSPKDPAHQTAATSSATNAPSSTVQVTKSNSPKDPPGSTDTSAKKAPSSTNTSTKTEGALVLRVNSHGPAAHHLRPGDVIRAVDGDPVRSMAELRSRLYVLHPGTRVHLDVVRRGASRVVNVVLGSSP